jgi:beta-glucosidase/6-phospho-beta-glucosidase/beta-galactosidase
MVQSTRELSGWLTVPSWEDDPMASGAQIVAVIDGYASEGGYDGAHQPATNHLVGAATNRCVAPGDAERLWERYEEVLDAVPTVGLGAVRCSLEWTRLEPRRGAHDAAAVDRYREVLAHARANGLRVEAAVIDSAWPAWLGQEAWLLPWVAPEFVRHSRFIAATFGDLLDGLVLVARPEMIDDGFLRGTTPPYRRGAASDAAAAHARLDGAIAEAMSDATVAALAVSHVEVPAVRSPEALSTLIASAPEGHEVHLRSLLRGAGPTQSPTPILEHGPNGWRSAVPDAVRALWSQ